MRLLVFGATGQTGRQLIAQGLQQGHHITAFVRNPAVLQESKNLTIVKGNISRAGDIENAVRGQDAVISVLGNKTSNAFWQANSTISQGLQVILAAMKKQNVKRLLFVSSFGASNNIFLPEKLFIKLVLKNIFADIPVQEQLIKNSGLDWTIVRPARLINGARTSDYRVGEDIHIGLFSTISRPDVADFLLKSISDKTVVRKTITLSY